LIGRIHTRLAFERVRRDGVRVRSAVLSCTMLLDESCDGPHVGYALSRHVGSAVRRNRLRRQLRELVKLRDDRLRPGWYVIGASPKATALSFAQLSDEMDSLVQRCAKVGAA